MSTTPVPTPTNLSLIQDELTQAQAKLSLYSMTRTVAYQQKANMTASELSHIIMMSDNDIAEAQERVTNLQVMVRVMTPAVTA